MELLSCVSLEHGLELLSLRRSRLRVEWSESWIEGLL
jgi:hypothetical protein